MIKKNSDFEVVVHLQQIATVKVKAESQINAEEKIRRFSEAYLKLNDDQKKVIPSFPFEVCSHHFDLLEVLEAGDMPPAINGSKQKKIVSGTKNELKKLMDLYNFSEQYIEDVKEEAKKDIDISNPEEFVELKKEQKVKFKE